MAAIIRSRREPNFIWAVWLTGRLIDLAAHEVPSGLMKLRIVPQANATPRNPMRDCSHNEVAIHHGLLTSNAASPPHREWFEGYRPVVLLDIGQT